MTFTKLKTLPLASLVLMALTIVGCSTTNNELTTSQINEQNQYVTDITQQFKIKEDLCMTHSQSIAELTNINGTPKAYYKLTQKRIPCH